MSLDVLWMSGHASMIEVLEVLEVTVTETVDWSASAECSVDFLDFLDFRGLPGLPWTSTGLPLSEQDLVDCCLDCLSGLPSLKLCILLRP